MFVCEGAYRRDLWWPQVTEVCKTFTPKSLAPDSAAKGFLLHYCTATDSVGSFYFWVLTPFFLTSSRSSFIRSSKSYSFCLSSSFFLLTSKRFFTWSRDDRSTRMDMPRFLWSVGAHTHTHTQRSGVCDRIRGVDAQFWRELTFLSVDVIQEVDGVFDDAVTNVTVVTAETSGVWEADWSETSCHSQHSNRVSQFYPPISAWGVVFVMTMVFPSLDSRSTL